MYQLSTVGSRKHYSHYFLDCDVDLADYAASPHNIASVFYLSKKLHGVVVNE